MIMKKRTYIQPEMEVVAFATSELMVPGGGSPINGQYDTSTQTMPAPSRRTPVF